MRLPLLTALGLWLACCGRGDLALAQTAAELAANPPGVWYNGQFFGYRGGRPTCGTAAPSGVTDACADGSGEAFLGDPGACDVECDVDFGICTLTDSPPLIYGQFEYLLWWSAGSASPTLATTSLSGTNDANAGVLGLASTTALFGGDLNTDLQSGGRFTLGTWLNPQQQSALEASFLFLGENRDAFSASQADFPILARPFFNVELGDDDARLIAFPGLISGTLNISATSEMQNMSLVYRRVAQRTSHARWDYLVGYRFSHLEDLVEIRESTVALSGPETGATRELFDRFTSRNTFHGGELGVALQRPLAPMWGFDASARVALGATQRLAQGTGQTTVATAVGSATTDGGLLTQQSNLGRFSDSSFGALSEFGFTLKRRVASHAKLTCGYTFLLWSDVWRAGEQIDAVVNPTQIPPDVLVGEARPTFPAAEARFWSHGLQLGLEATY